MSELRICFEVSGLATDENGNPCPSGMQISLGKTEKEINYVALTKAVNIQGILQFTGLARFLKPEDVKIITPGEYDQKYSDVY